MGFFRIVRPLQVHSLPISCASYCCLFWMLLSLRKTSCIIFKVRQQTKQKRVAEFSCCKPANLVSFFFFLCMYFHRSVYKRTAARAYSTRREDIHSSNSKSSDTCATECAPTSPSRALWCFDSRCKRDDGVVHSFEVFRCF